VLKPDLVAPGSEVIAATGSGWDLVTGTSPAAARVAGTAAVLLARPGARPVTVRSALRTTAAPLDHQGALREGSGLARLAGGTGLAYVVRPSAYRAWLSGDRSQLNLPQILLSEGRLRARRTLTNMSSRAIAITAHLEGFDSPVWISPAYARLGPGDSVRFRVVAAGTRTSSDDGTVRWHTEAGDTARIPVVITR
jgi:minor extracellular serine protease Vpr